MFHNVMPAVIVLGIAYAIYKLVELFARRRERMAVIEKMSLGDGVIIPPDIAKWYAPAPVAWGLRLGLLLTGLGLGLGLAVVMDYCMNDLPNGDVLYFALMLLFGGIGLVIAYLIEQKDRNRNV